MAKFKVVVDHKVTAWDRYTFIVKAETLEDATEKVMNAADLIQYEGLDSINDDEEIVLDDISLQLETVEPMSLCENYAAANCEQFVEGGQVNKSLEEGLYDVSRVIKDECEKVSK